MYKKSDYYNRAYNFIHNRFFPKKKRLSTLALFGTDLCDSACKHCMIWTKRPVNYLPFEKIKEIMQSKCISKSTTVALAGGEYLLHPEAIEIMGWFREHHPNFDLLTNALKPDFAIEAIKKHPPRRLYISLDGDKDSYLHMRGKDGYDGIIKVIEALHKVLPISLMFTLSPYNDFKDLEHVANVCKKYNLDLRVGVYNDISFFDTIENAHNYDIGALKSPEIRSFSEAKQAIKNRSKTETTLVSPVNEQKSLINIRENLPANLAEFSENYDFLVLYDEWRRGGLKLSCNSILDSVVVLPNGDIPICQNLDVLIGNIYTNSLDEIINTEETRKKQKHYSQNCNACWINFHRKYDIILHRSFERYFGKFATSKLLGYYWWEKDKKKSYRKMIG
ncbi:MAG TPA: radical SAM/SPASM domain-containing protein [Chitinophagaceae bacterium]|nr:radical SAM/SPASM domain-containing protein [Chitinophagaceae bacterium]